VPLGPVRDRGGAIDCDDRLAKSIAGFNLFKPLQRLFHRTRFPLLLDFGGAPSAAKGGLSFDRPHAVLPNASD